MGRGAGAWLPFAHILARTGIVTSGVLRVGLLVSPEAVLCCLFSSSQTTTNMLRIRIEMYIPYVIHGRGGGSLLLILIIMSLIEETHKSQLNIQLTSKQAKPPWRSLTQSANWDRICVILLN